MQDLLCRIGTISDAVWCTWKKVQGDYKLQYLKVVTNGHQYIKTNEDKKVYILNKRSLSNWKIV